MALTNLIYAYFNSLLVLSLDTLESSLNAGAVNEDQIFVHFLGKSHVDYPTATITFKRSDGAISPELVMQQTTFAYSRSVFPAGTYANSYTFVFYDDWILALKGPLEATVRLYGVNGNVLVSGKMTLSVQPSVFSPETTITPTQYTNLVNQINSLATNDNAVKIILPECQNDDTVQLTVGMPVYASGSIGTSGKIKIKRASALSFSQSNKLFGVVAQTINIGNSGNVMILGELQGVNTTGLTEGQPVFVSVNSGQLTSTAPTAPNHRIVVGGVIRTGNNGIIYVKQQLGLDVAELCDVEITSVQNGNILRYNNSIDVWENTGALTTAESNITNLQGRMTTEEGNVDNLQGRMTTAETDINNIENGTTIVGRANADKDNNEFDATYLKKTTATATYIPLSQKAQPFGVATLGIDGRVLSNQIPGVVLSVEEYDTLEDFPESGVTTTVYLAVDTQLTYLWSGIQYVALSSNLALGETSATAYRGDRGKIAYDYSQVGHLPLAGGTVTGNLIVGGDLTISGTTTTVNTTQVDIKDNIILINSNQTGEPNASLKGGLEIERGNFTNFQFVFDESDDRFKVGQVDSLQTVATRTDDGTIANRGITFFNTSTNRLENNANIVIDSANNVGIGTSTPAAKLEVSNSSNVETSIRIFTSGVHSTYIGNKASDTNLYISNTTSGGSLGDATKSITLQSSGNVGIGTTNPVIKLTVNGDIAIPYGGAIKIYNPSNNTLLGVSNLIRVDYDSLSLNDFTEINVPGTTSSHIRFLTGVSSARTERMRIASNGNVGIGTGTTSPAQRLVVNDGNIDVVNAGGGNITFVNPGVNAYQIKGGADLQFLANGGSNERMRITGTGNVGIGTPSALSNLTVNGDIAISYGSSIKAYNSSNNTFYTNSEMLKSFYDGTSDNDVTSISSPGQINSHIRFLTGVAGARTEKVRINSDGDVGIGTASPGQKLYVEGAKGAAGMAEFKNTTTSGNVSGILSALSGNGNNTSSYHYAGLTAGVNVWYLYGNGTTSYSSDERLKKNIETTRDGYLEDLMKLRVVKYNWHNSEDGTPKELGLIAQEVEKVFPGLIQEHDMLDVGPRKNIKHSVMEFIFIKSIQELKQEVESLKAELDELKAKVA